MMTAQEETLSSALAEIIQCLDSHYEELSLHSGRYEWRCDWKMYYAAEAEGQLLLVTLRSDGRLVGYFVGFVRPGLHYQDCITLTMDVFYIVPSARNKSAGAFKLFRKVEAMAKARGVSLLYYGSKLHMDSGRLFKAMGLTPVETWYSKWLSPKGEK